MKRRCTWCGEDPLYVDYHDLEWGVPLHDDRRLFEMLVLEGAQAGLNWLTILRRRDSYRRAFHGFDPTIVAGYSQGDVERLLADPGIIRNRAKVASAIRNAGAFLAVQEQQGTFSAYLWQFVDHTPVQNRWVDGSQLPASTSVSVALSKDLKRRGFSFVGPTICYALMQSVGMVNDHTLDCFRHGEVERLAVRSSQAAGTQA